MHISQIMLRDWKVYPFVKLEFPAPEPDKNIILIGGSNGYGKTSLFEAIILGLFGQDGLPLIARSPFLGSDKEQLATSYKKFLEKALHHGATTAGRASCSVNLIFIDDEGEPLEIQRTWHFSNSGMYRSQDDEVYIYEGTTRKAVDPDGLNQNDRTEWFREYITKNVLPFTLAHFFMFDGEQVSVLAERKMSDQVQLGIEGLLGIPVLKQLAKDLRIYAEARRKEVPNGAEKTIEKMEKERHELSLNSDRNTKRLNEIKSNRTAQEKKQEKLYKELASVGVSSQALQQEQLKKNKDLERKIDDGQSQLEKLMTEDLALALSSPDLISCVKAQLSSEIVRERWESGKNQGDDNLDRFLTTVDVSMQNINPALTNEQHSLILEYTRSAWEQLWNPPPENCADEYLHPWLNEVDRTRIIDQLNELNDLGASSIINLLDQISANQKSLRRLQEEITRAENISPDLDTKRKDLLQVNEKIQKIDQEVGALQREIKVLEEQINQKNKELIRLSNQINQAAPSARRATRADEVAQIVDDIVVKAVPSQIDAIAIAMTKAHRSMAHKKDLVERIEIDENCDVKLLNNDDIDLRDHDLSAGEKQIFTQALISAVSSVSGRGFPMVIDTPLGRLDIEHRKGILNHLTQREHQVILLSTDTEVVEEYLDDIATHVQKKYLLDFEQIGKIGQSKIHQDYFKKKGQTHEYLSN